MRIYYIDIMKNTEKSENRMRTSDKAFKENMKSIERQISNLKLNLKRFSERQNNEKGNWGYAGTASNILREISEINESYK